MYTVLSVIILIDVFIAACLTVHGELSVTCVCTVSMGMEHSVVLMVNVSMDVLVDGHVRHVMVCIYLDRSIVF